MIDKSDYLSRSFPILERDPEYDQIEHCILHGYHDKNPYVVHNDPHQFSIPIAMGNMKVVGDGPDNHYHFVAQYHDNVFKQKSETSIPLDEDKDYDGAE